MAYWQERDLLATRTKFLFLPLSKLEILNHTPSLQERKKKWAACFLHFLTLLKNRTAGSVKVLEVLQTELQEDRESDGVACVPRCMAAFLGWKKNNFWMDNANSAKKPPTSLPTSLGPSTWGLPWQKQAFLFSQHSLLHHWLKTRPARLPQQYPSHINHN